MDEKTGAIHEDIRVGSILEDVTPDHYVRIYAPQEVSQAAQIMNDPAACPTWPAIFHSHGETWEYLEEDESSGQGKNVHILSPFRSFNEYMPTVVGPRKHPAPLKDDAPLNLPMVIAGLLKLLASKYPKRGRGMIAQDVADLKLLGAGKTNVNKAFSLANQALSGDPAEKLQTDFSMKKKLVALK